MATEQDKQAPAEGEVIPPASAKKDEPKKKADKPKSVLTDKDKRELTLKVRTEATEVMNPVVYEQMRMIANDLWQSGALPNSYENHQQVFMAIQLGNQMGFSPHEAILNGYYVSGRYNVYGKALPSALRRAGWRYTFKETDQHGGECTINLKHSKTGEEITDTFSFQDAVKSGFTTDNRGQMKFGWKEGANRKRKLRYAVIAQVVNTYLPEVLGGIADVAEYSSDYIEGQVIQDDNNQSINVKKDAIADKVKSFSSDVKPTEPKPVEV